MTPWLLSLLCHTLPGKPLWPVLTLQVSSGALLPGQNGFWPSVHSGPAENGRISTMNFLRAVRIQKNFFLYQFQSFSPTAMLHSKYQWYQFPGLSRSPSLVGGPNALHVMQFETLKKGRTWKNHSWCGKRCGKRMQFVIVRRFLMFSLFLYALRLNLNLACTQRQPLTDSGMGLHLFASCCDMLDLINLILCLLRSKSENTCQIKWTNTGMAHDKSSCTILHLVHNRLIRSHKIG